MLKLAQLGRILHSGGRNLVSGEPVSLNTHRILTITQFRTRYNNKNSSQDDSDSEDDEIDSLLANDKTLMRTSVNSLRMDAIIKAGLGMARNKVETKFYENRIRLNGKKIPKKSMQMGIGDEVDVIKGVSPQHDGHLIVGRIEIVSAKAKEESIGVVLRRFKSLIIENYPGANSWKSSSENSS